MNNITLKKIRPWTITQADIEGYEDIHFEEREINYEIYKPNPIFNRNISIWCGNAEDLEIDLHVICSEHEENVLNIISNKVIIANLNAHLNKIKEFINEKKIRTLSFQNISFEDKMDNLLRSIREWFESSSIDVERIIIAINNNEDDLIKVEQQMIKYFPPCKDTEYYNQYWEKEREWLMKPSKSNENISGEDITKLFMDIHSEWRKKLEEAMNLSKEND